MSSNHADATPPSGVGTVLGPFVSADPVLPPCVAHNLSVPSSVLQLGSLWRPAPPSVHLSHPIPKGSCHHQISRVHCPRARILLHRNYHPIRLGGPCQVLVEYQ